MSAILRAYLDRVIANMTIRANPVPPAFVNRPRVEIDLGPPRRPPGRPAPDTRTDRGELT